MTKKKTVGQKLHELLYDALTSEDEGEAYTMTIEHLKELCKRDEPSEESVCYARKVAAELAKESEVYKLT